MREYQLTIDEALRNGISPDDSMPPNSQFLYDCLGVRCGRVGLEPYTTLTDPLEASITAFNWPFPQIIHGDAFNVLIVRDALNDYVYTFTAGHVVTLRHTLDFATYGTGQLMQVADFGEYIYMCNGEVVVHTPAGVWTAVNIGTDALPILGAACNFKGQLVGGNCQSVFEDADETFYVWSGIGEIDFTLDADNESGYRRCPYGGLVKHTKRLGDAVIGYSSKGITMLVPVSDPTVTFGFKEMSDVGLINRGAIAGDYLRHVYVGTDYCLREITKEGVKEFGCEWLLSQMVDDIIVTFDPAKRDFYISDGITTYLLSPYGLSKIQQHPSAVWRIAGQTYLSPDTEDATDPFIVTWPFDFGYAGQKTNHIIELSAINYENAEATVDYLNEGAWTTSGYIPVNHQGVATVIASGDAFRFRVKFGTLSNDFKMLHLKSRYKMTDLRAIRGVYAPPPRGQ